MSKIGRVFIDCFTSLDDIPVKRRSEPKVLLEFFKTTKTRRVSTFEMTPQIWRAMQILIETKQIELTDEPYPWHGFKLIEAHERA